MRAILVIFGSEVMGLGESVFELFKGGYQSETKKYRRTAQKKITVYKDLH